MNRILLILIVAFLYIGNIFASDSDVCSVTLDETNFKEIIDKLGGNELAKVNISKIYDDLKAAGLKDLDIEDFKKFLEVVQKDEAALEALTFFIQKDIDNKNVYKVFIKNTVDKYNILNSAKYKGVLRSSASHILAESLITEHKSALAEAEKMLAHQKNLEKKKTAAAKEQEQNKGKTANLVTSTVTSAVNQYLVQKNSINK